MEPYEAREIAAKAWCDNSTSHLDMIPELAEAFAKILVEEVGKASRASAPVTAPDYRIADRGFRWDAENRQHIPQLLIEFTPVPENAPNASSGWKDRDKLAAMLVAAPTPPSTEDRWLPIDTAPKDGSKFLAWRRHSTIPLIVFYNAEYDQYECNDGNLVFSLTHWMPLPKAPAMQEDKP